MTWRVGILRKVAAASGAPTPYRTSLPRVLVPQGGYLILASSSRLLLEQRLGILRTQPSGARHSSPRHTTSPGDAPRRNAAALLATRRSPSEDGAAPPEMVTILSLPGPCDFRQNRSCDIYTRRIHGRCRPPTPQIAGCTYKADQNRRRTNDEVYAGASSSRGSTPTAAARRQMLSIETCRSARSTDPT